MSDKYHNVCYHTETLSDSTVIRSGKQQYSTVRFQSRRISFDAMISLSLFFHAK